MNQPAVSTVARDLRQEPPRSPRERIHGYSILARMADKGRAVLNGTAGEYHFNCPVDNLLFGFKGVDGEQVRQLLASGASDEEVANWLDAHGARKSKGEIAAWADAVESSRPYDDPAKQEWFVEECRRLGLDPKLTTLFDYLETDDRLSFQL